MNHRNYTIGIIIVQIQRIQELSMLMINMLYSSKIYDDPVIKVVAIQCIIIMGCSFITK